MAQSNALKAKDLVRDSGGQVVGRTRFQKIAYLLAITGLDDGFHFVYKHYGPYADELSVAVHEASLLGLVREAERQASWGGSYSIYSVDEPINSGVHPARVRLAAEAAAADAIELELAATAAFLAKEGVADPWKETARRKPEKAEGLRLEKAKELYRRLSSIETPIRLPNL